IIYLLTGRKMFIHELQAEPWGPVGTSEMPVADHLKSMNLSRIKANISYARATRLTPIDLWGLEWWYFLLVKNNDREIWDYFKNEVF
ncbi:MAG: hypothetical protein M3Q36_00365, partial [bacterium]|nr:hypothetical protein [bacterium]